MAITVRRRRGVSGAEVAAALARRKLRAFARIEDEFIASFHFVADVHGQRRFAAFTVADVARYLHALVTCAFKDRLLSVPQSVARYEGARALAVLRGWQEGDDASVIAFIHQRLDHQPFAELTRSIADSREARDEAGVARLISGRMVLLNRLFNLAGALDALISADPERLRGEVRAECRKLGHTPEQITRQLASLRAPLFQYAPHPDLARRNMLVMNEAGRRLASAAGERPGERTDRVRPGEAPVAPWAETPIPRLSTQLSLRWRPRTDLTPRGSDGVPVALLVGEGI